MAPSFLDIMAKKSIGATRMFYSRKLKVVSTEVKALRFTLSDPDNWGQMDKYVEENTIENIVINFPLGEDQEVFLSKDALGNTKIQGIDLGEVLPVEAILPFDVKDIQEQDIFVTVFLDEVDAKMPVIWQVTRMKGAYRHRHLIKKIAQLSLYRGQLETEVKLYIDNYVQNYN